jgi:hypothetical protein
MRRPRRDDGPLFANGWKPYRGEAPSVRGDSTSEAAAASKAATKAADERRVWDHIRNLGTWGATCDEVEVDLGLLHQNASARIRTLVLEGKLRDSKSTRLTRHKREAHVWVVVEVPF